MKGQMVRMSLEISPELAEKLDQICAQLRCSKSDVLRKAIALMDVAVESKKVGNKIAVVNAKGQKTGDILGF